MDKDMTMTDEAIALIIKKGYWRTVRMGNKRQGCMKVEVCTTDHQSLLLLQQVFGGKIKRQDSIWRYFCGKSVDMAHIAVNLLPYARTLGVEMHRYCRASGEKRYLYVLALQKKYGSNSIKISKYATTKKKKE